MSHEIRTPMNGIIGFIELLSGMQMEREQASYLAEIKASTDALLLLINDILDYSKIEAGKLLIETLPFNFHRLIEESVFLFAPKAHGKGIEIVSYIETRVPIEVQGDPGRLRQVLNNIIGNAVKFTDKGEVAVKVRVLKESKEKVLLQIEIQDTGIGISDKTKQQLFQIFMQADASTTRKYEGTGLGLAISKKILELLGGTIEVVSELDKGSTFIITLELEKGQLGDEEQKIRPPKSTNLNGLKVMIVDDNASNRIIFSEYLGETGCKVISANDGIAGLEILKGLTSESLPQIVLVDYQMPGLSGLEFGELLLKDERLKDIRLILITSAAQKGDAKLAQTMGFVGYLSKPVRKKELIDVISGVDVLETPGTTGNLVTRHLVIEKHCNVPNISILLVEDMLANQKLEMAMLKKLGHSVELAINGKQAVEICNTKKYDLILMDCQMPVMDGYEATDQIRKASVFNKNTTIIAMTAHAMEGDREKCIEAGMDDYISKPITMAIIKDTIGRYFQEIIPDSL
jgi:CheY-like chemotaxis protein